MDDPVDGRRRRHRVLEYPVPLGENEVRGDDDGPPLVAFRQEGEQNLRLIPGLLDIADVIDLC
jgi:hypothetical protein